MSATGILTSALVDSGNKYTQVSVKAVSLQIILMTSISVATLIAFSFFRPRERKVYAPKLKYHLADEDEVPPPPLGSGFFSWLKPLLTQKDIDLVDTLGVDAVAFLQFLSLLRWFFLSVSILACAVLIPINYLYSPSSTNTLSRLTISGLGTKKNNTRYNDKILFVHVGAVYIITFLLLYFCWFYWRKMLSLRKTWFLSKKFQRSIQTRSLMVVNVKKEYQSDEGLKVLIMKLRGGNEKLASNIQSAMIGRDLKDYPDMIEDYNNTVREFEEILVKYLKNGQEGKHRPTIKRGGFLGLGAQKVDAIEFYGNKLGRLREILDSKKEDIDQLKPKHKKNGKPAIHPSQHQDLSQKEMTKMAKKIKIPAENYGFVSMMDAAQAHAVAKGHRGSQKSLYGAQLTLAPALGDILWNNAKITPGERFNSKIVGFALLSLVCFFNTVPLIIVAAAANLVTLSSYISFLAKWQDAGQWGDWTFSIVAGVLPPSISAVFQLLLPYLIRKLTKYQGATSRSQVDRIVLTRYYAFLVISQFFIFSLITVFVNLGVAVASEVRDHKSFSEIYEANIATLPSQIQQTYVSQSTYWLTFFPLRGFLVFFELAQLVKLALLSIRTFLFAKTPRDIQEWSRPPFFQYPIVYANLLFLTTIGLVYAPLAPLVVAFATIVFWLSHYVYKYQLLYVYSSRTESGGRMWNVAINRLLIALMFMQLLMVLTIALQTKSLSALASAPPFLITLLFKIFVLRPYANEFQYFMPTPEEAQGLLAEARHSYKQRFIHPALRDDVLFTVTVHKDQQDLVRQILAPYSSKLQREVAGVRETDLTEYNATLDAEKTVNVDEAGHVLPPDDNESIFSKGSDRPNVGRTYTQDSAGGVGYHHYEDSTVDLVHSAAPMGASEGWYGRQQSFHEDDEPMEGNQYHLHPGPTNLTTLPLLQPSTRTPALESPPEEEYQMDELPTRTGYGFVPTTVPHEEEDDMDLADYYTPRYQSSAHHQQQSNDQTRTSGEIGRF